ncbi:MAG TPA: PilW family protein [Rhizobacter sp.]
MHAPKLQSRRYMTGISLVEMMVAIAIGLVITAVMSVVYINSRSAGNRQTQLSGMQQSVRMAFEYMAFDARMVGHLGCFTRHSPTELVLSSPADISNNFRLGVEGYEYMGTGPNNTFALPSALPADTTSASSWTNSPTATTATVPLASISGSSTVGLTPGSDILIVRSAGVGRPVRLSGTVAGPATAIPIDNRSTGTCPDGTANVSGFCANSFGIIASCTNAQTFQVTNIAGASLTLGSPLQVGPVYAANASEVFPMQTAIYYVKRSSNDTTTSLYRRVLDGAQDQEQELIENIESLQVRYGIDSTAPDPDGIIDGDYVTADTVTDWSRVIAVRVSLLMRSPNREDGGLVATTPLAVNGATFTRPSSGPVFDRRVFTTTIALRNRIAYAAP